MYRNVVLPLLSANDHEITLSKQYIRRESKSLILFYLQHSLKQDLILVLWDRYSSSSADNIEYYTACNA